MSNAPREDDGGGSRRGSRRGYAPVAAWLMAGFFSGVFLFMYSGAMAHGAKVTDPTMGSVGTIIASLGPLAAYATYRLLSRLGKSRIPQGLLLLAALVIFVLCQWLGLTLLERALPHGITHFG